MSESDTTELQRLKAENDYLRAENHTLGFELWRLSIGEDITSELSGKLQAIICEMGDVGEHNAERFGQFLDCWEAWKAENDAA